MDNFSHEGRRQTGRAIGRWCSEEDFPVEALVRAVEHIADVSISQLRMEQVLAGKVAPTPNETGALIATMKDLDPEAAARYE